MLHDEDRMLHDEDRLFQDEDKLLVVARMKRIRIVLLTN